MTHHNNQDIGYKVYYLKDDDQLPSQSNVQDGNNDYYLYESAPNKNAESGVKTTSVNKKRRPPSVYDENHYALAVCGSSNENIQSNIPDSEDDNSITCCMKLKSFLKRYKCCLIAVILMITIASIGVGAVVVLIRLGIIPNFISTFGNTDNENSTRNMPQSTSLSPISCEWLPWEEWNDCTDCLLYTSPSPRDS